eukprot:gene31000-7105_t
MSGRKKRQATAKGVGDGEACDTSSVSKKQPSFAKFFKTTSTAEEEDSTYVHSSYSHVQDHLAVPSTSNDDVVRSSIMHLYVPPQPKDKDDCLHSTDKKDTHVPDVDPYTPPPHPYNKENAFVFDRSRQCNYSSIPHTDPHIPPFSSPYEDQGRSDTKAAEPSLARSVGGGAFKNHGVTRLLADFGEKGRNGEWPSSTNVSCY